MEFRGVVGPSCRQAGPGGEAPLFFDGIHRAHPLPLIRTQMLHRRLLGGLAPSATKRSSLCRCRSSSTRKASSPRGSSSVRRRRKEAGTAGSDRSSPSDASAASSSASSSASARTRAPPPSGGRRPSASDYSRQSPREHVLLRPQMYVGSTEPVTSRSWAWVMPPPEGEGVGAAPASGIGAGPATAAAAAAAGSNGVSS